MSRTHLEELHFLDRLLRLRVLMGFSKFKGIGSGFYYYLILSSSTLLPVLCYTLSKALGPHRVNCKTQINTCLGRSVGERKEGSFILS